MKKNSKETSEIWKIQKTPSKECRQNYAENSDLFPYPNGQMKTKHKNIKWWCATQISSSCTKFCVALSYETGYSHDHIAYFSQVCSNEIGYVYNVFMLKRYYTGYVHTFSVIACLLVSPISIFRIRYSCSIVRLCMQYQSLQVNFPSTNSRYH